MDEEQVLSAIDTAMGMVLESKGKFTHNTITISMTAPDNIEYELVITFRKKADT